MIVAFQPGKIRDDMGFRERFGYCGPPALKGLSQRLS
jgi:hypothetical protein